MAKQDAPFVTFASWKTWDPWDLEVWGEVSGCCARSFTWWKELQKQRHAGPWTWSEWRFSRVACEQPKSIFLYPIILYIFPSFSHISIFAFLNSLLNIFQHPTWESLYSHLPLHCILALCSQPGFLGRMLYAD